MTSGILATSLVLGFAHLCLSLRPLGHFYSHELNRLNGELSSRGPQIYWDHTEPAGGWANLEKEVQILQFINEGHSGKIYLVNDIKLNKNNVILKVVSKKHVNATKQIQYENELQVLQKLQNGNNTNICGFYRFFQDKDNIFYTLENCGASNLKLFMDKYHSTNPGTMPEHLVCQIFKQVINGVEELHNQSLYHQGLKLPNIFYDDVNGVVKIGDFMKTVKSNTKFFPKQIVNPTVPPEKIKGTSTLPSKLDVWSMGFGMFRMIAGDSRAPDHISLRTYPYKGLNVLSPELNELLGRIFTLPEERLTLQEMKTHKWFSKTC